MPKFFTVTQIAEATGYSSKTVQRALDEGELRGVRRGERGYWRIDVASGEKFLAACGAKTPKPTESVKRKKRAAR